MPVYALLRAVNRELVKFTSSLLFSQVYCNSYAQTALNKSLRYATIFMEGGEEPKRQA